MIRTFSLILLMLVANALMAQGNLDLYKGNQAYADGDFEKAENAYKQSLQKQPNRFESNYNLGNALYKKQDLDNAIKYYQQALASEKDAMKQARAYHNLGNVYLESQKIDEAINAYKQALRLNPSDDETRYNLAYAQRLKRQQQQQQQEENKEQQEKEEDQQDQENQENKDGENKEQEEKEQQKEENKDKQGDEKKEQPKEGEEGKEEKPERELEISPREAEQMLEAAKNEDQKTLMQLKKQKGEPKKIDKDW